MYNTTYSGWIEDGDFETGTGDAWNWYNLSPAYVTQSTDSTLDTYSLNMSIPNMDNGSAYARTYEIFPSASAYHALYPRMNIIELDWKYNDTVGAGPSQYAYLRLQFTNASTYTVLMYFGYGTDTIPGINSTSTYYISMPGFGSRDVWQHSEVDLYEICNEFNFINLTLRRIDLYIYQGMYDAGVELLVDDFRMMTYPTSDPTFEYVDNWGNYDPFTGWLKYSGTGDISQSTESHGGHYSANITVENAMDGLFRNGLYIDVDSALGTDFWWYLDDIQSTGVAYASIQMEFILSGMNRYIHYVLGKSAAYTTTNDTSIKYILVDGFNQTGTWTHLTRNITADFEIAFSPSTNDWYMY